MEIGSIIKFHRLNKGLTQDKLANGIISKSYLSKIENNLSIPDQEVIQFIFNRLDISNEDHENDLLDKYLKRWVWEIIMEDQVKLEETHTYILEKLPYIKDSKYMKIFEIQKIKFLIIMNNYKEAKNQIEKLKPILSDFTSAEKYYWYKFIGDYYQYKCNFERAYENYKSAENFLNFEILYYEHDKHDLQFELALTAIQSHKYHVSIEYAKNALLFYQSEYKLKRCARCHLIIGAAYKQLKEIDLAIKSNNKAYNIAININENKILANCYQNLASLYYEIGNIEQAVKYFTESYELKKLHSLPQKLITVLGLVKLYYQKGTVKDAEFWISKGDEILEYEEELTSLVSLKFRLYKYLIVGESEDFEQFILEETIPLLKQKNLQNEISFYYKVLADYYYKDSKYKLSCYYYQQSMLTGDSYHYSF